MCGVGHEPPHVRDAALNRRCGLSSEQPAADGDERQRDERGRAEDRDERRVAVFELDLVGNGDRSQRASPRQLDSLRMRAEQPARVGEDDRRAAVAQRRARKVLDALWNRGVVQRSAECVDEHQRSIRNSEIERRIKQGGCAGRRPIPRLRNARELLAGHDE